MLKWMATALGALTIATSLPAQQVGSSEDLKQQQADIQLETDQLRNALADSGMPARAGLCESETVQEKLPMPEVAIEDLPSNDFYTGTGGGRKSAGKRSKTASKKTTKIKKKVKVKEEYVDPEVARASGNFEHNKGKLPWPVANALVKIHFGAYRIPDMEVIGNNPGLTLSTDQDAEVKAVYEGEVLSVFNVEGNRSVMVRHGQYFTVYANLASVTVSKNDKITAGQTIGFADNASDGKGEIEFILMKERTNIDPAKWIRKK